MLVQSDVTDSVSNRHITQTSFISFSCEESTCTAALRKSDKSRQIRKSIQKFSPDLPEMTVSGPATARVKIRYISTFTGDLGVLQFSGQEAFFCYFS